MFCGQYLAIGRLDGCVTIVDFETKRTIKFLMGHVKPITSLDWSRNSRYLLSSSRDWNVIIWDLNSGERKQTVRFDAPVTSAQFHPINRFPENYSSSLFKVKRKRFLWIFALKVEDGNWTRDNLTSLPTQTKTHLPTRARKRTRLPLASVHRVGRDRLLPLLDSIPVVT
ncbi:hypothetical protein PtA15_7A788 [Puccinia triticina]|uniref:Anaphase-promoting complex subunit 4 WD40 domain-containing protein n=1 Tax=Puccinia triticina TaxID=208348 RepID=A0ABY7CP72_9BASI|nr:uncharacterized protein PtA15_7A788 [Puccinia triticina]WAQ87059.1 hypothetical protein PtA15_7A788 [Puccinia triticina]WAR56915.1 hypothetical protein PtB15_7B768 [Puccinia triticina]